MTATLYRQNGCNRGGIDHASQLLRRLPTRPSSTLALELVDPEPGRAEGLARTLTSRNLAVKARRESAPLPGPASIDVYAIDDLTVLERSVARSLENPVVELAFLVSVPEVKGVGGLVVAIAAVLTPDAPGIQEATRRLLGKLNALVRGRESSVNMAAHGVHACQMPGVRHTAHDWLTAQSAAFLQTGVVEPGLVLFDGFTCRPYRLDVVETRQDIRRRALRQQAIEQILPQCPEREERRGVAFVDGARPWVYLVLARQQLNRWRLERAFELPVVAPSQEPEEDPLPVPTFVTD